MATTKERITQYIDEKTKEFNLERLDEFTTNAIAEEMYISRSIASQYLNELVEEGVIFKIKSRPVYFFSVHVLEKKYHISLNECDFIDVEDMLDFLRINGSGNHVFENLVGYDGSLSRLIQQSTEIFDYPPDGLPLFIYGEEGTGRKTLAELICRNSILNDGVAKKETRIIREEVSSTDNNGLIERLNRLIKDEHKQNTIVILGRMEKIDDKLEKYLIDFFEARNTGSIHMIFISTLRPGMIMSPRLSKNIPLAVHLHSFDERPREEREEIIMKLFEREEKVLGVTLMISSNVLRTLAKKKYADNIQGLSSVIKLICARARRSSQDTTIKIHTYDMPSELLEDMEISEENPAYFSCGRYLPGKETDVYLDFCKTVLGLFEKYSSPAELFTNYKAVYSQVEEHLLMKDDIDRYPQGMEVSIVNFIQTVMQKHYMSLPSSITRVISKILNVYHEHRQRFQKWEEENKETIKYAIEKVQMNFVSDTIIIDELKERIESGLETEFPDIARIIACLSLHQFNRDLANRKVYGIILCHGYATASSIAAAVNALIGNYVFDAIDMPLNTTAEEIRHTLQDRLQMINRFADVVVMVDMGSLEEIASETVLMNSRNVALINNVTTKMALDIGYKILNNQPIEQVFADVDKQFKVEYRIIHGRKSDTILFISESGMQTAQRMADLFRDSLPEEIPVNLQIGQFEKITSGGIADLMETTNLLFVIGTEDPGLDGIIFIPLEDLITTGCLDIISQKLSSYMTMDNVEKMIVNIRRNFTLINVVNYLTILNPQPLLDCITVAVDNLQKRMDTELEGRRLIGIYIHLCVLVERLVTKQGILRDDKSTNDFIKEHCEFVRNIHDSFRNVKEYYHIEIPDSEMKYIYSFMTGE